MSNTGCREFQNIGDAFTLLARVCNASGIPFKIADITSIGYSIVDHTAGDIVIDSGTLTPSLVMFDTLQVPGEDPNVSDEPWRKDSIGYNFRVTFSGQFITTEWHWYEVIIDFNDTTNGTTRGQWRRQAKHTGVAAA